MLYSDSMERQSGKTRSWAKSIRWLDLESKHLTETGMENMSKSLGIFVAKSAEHFKCIWQFQSLDVKRVTILYCLVASDIGPIFLV